MRHVGPRVHWSSFSGAAVASATSVRNVSPTSACKQTCKSVVAPDLIGSHGDDQQDRAQRERQAQRRHHGQRFEQRECRGAGGAFMIRLLPPRSAKSAVRMTGRAATPKRWSQRTSTVTRLSRGRSGSGSTRTTSLGFVHAVGPFLREFLRGRPFRRQRAPRLGSRRFEQIVGKLDRGESLVSRCLFGDRECRQLRRQESSAMPKMPSVTASSIIKKLRRIAVDGGVEFICSGSSKA